MTSARVEELSDSDPDEVDISTVAIRSERNEQLFPDPKPKQQANPYSDIDKAEIRHWTCIYPIYFDSSRTRADGRRVGKSQAVSNPLARQIVDAVGSLGYRPVFEPGKCHPKDWANPGRVKVNLGKSDKTGASVSAGVDSKHHLFLKIAEYLKQNPTAPSDPLKLRIPGLPTPKEPLPPPAAPRGWRMGTILPLHSPAVTGGGVSENLFKDMMAEMQQQGAVDKGKSKKIKA